jgi:DNA-binding CsgD family transcriptional regulator
VCFRVYFKRKNVKHIALLKEQERAKRVRERETYALEKLKTEKQMLVLKEKNLSLEIENKNAELASLTLKRLQRNELISALKENVKELKNSTQDVELNTQIKKLLKKTDNLLVDKEDWLSFELHFRNAHENFFKNIREKHKDLSSNEYKLSAYLKINLSSKEIASLMHISTRSVEQNRYRLRQKMNLDKEENLVRYIQSF